MPPTLRFSATRICTGLADEFLLLAGAVTAASLGIGTAAAYAIARYSFPGRGALLALFTAPLLLPGITIGLALLLVFSQLGLLATFSGLMLGHGLVAMPFIIRIVLTALRGIPVRRPRTQRRHSAERHGASSGGSRCR